MSNDIDGDWQTGDNDWQWQDDWQLVGEAELVVMKCLVEWGEVSGRAWKLDREVSGRNVARWLDVPLALCHYIGRAKMARWFFDIIGGFK